MLGRAAVCLSLFLAACESSPSRLPMNHPRDGMLQFEIDDMTLPPADMATAPLHDLAMAPADLAKPRSDMAHALGGCHVVVNEVLLSALKGSTSKESEEYLELFNPCASSQSLKGWSLRYRSLSNNSGVKNPDTTLVADLSKTISAGAYLLWAGSQYTGAHDGTLTNGLGDTGGGVALYDDNDSKVDSVAYGPVVASHKFTEGAPAPLPAEVAEPGQVIARTPDGTDSDDNSADFQTATPTPKAAN